MALISWVFAAEFRVMIRRQGSFSPIFAKAGKKPTDWSVFDLAL
jgi:hypothetical protein